MVTKPINDLLEQKDDFLEILKENIRAVISEVDGSAVADIDKRLEDLQKPLLKLSNSKEDYNDIADEIYNLRKLKHKVLAEDGEKKGSKQRIEDMTAFLNGQSTYIEECDEQLIRRLIGKITVYEERFTVEFKSGVEVDVEM